MAIQKTYSMIKPDGVRNGHIGEIVNRFERAGLTGLQDNQKIGFELQSGRDGRESASDLKLL